MKILEITEPVRVQREKIQYTVKVTIEMEGERILTREFSAYVDRQENHEMRNINVFPALREAAFVWLRMMFNE